MRGRWWRWFRRLFLVSVLSWIVLVVLLVITIHTYGTQDNAQEADLIVVLGAGLRRDGSPGFALTRRANHAAELYFQGLAPRILCTGAQADFYPRSEAEGCQEVLQRQGIPANAILLEETSHSTEENAIQTQNIMTDAQWESLIIVSDSYHVYRANHLFQSVGIQTYTSPVPFNQIRGFPSYAYSLAREVLAVHWQFVKDALNLPFTSVYAL